MDQSNFMRTLQYYFELKLFNKHLVYRLTENTVRHRPFHFTPLKHLFNINFLHDITYSNMMNKIKTSNVTFY